MEDLSISRSTPLSNFKRSGEVLAIVVDGVGATISQPYAVAVFSVTASAAFRITSSTKLGWDSIGTWLLSVSKVFAPIRFATKRSKAGWMVRSLLATMYQLGFDLQAVPSTF